MEPLFGPEAPFEARPSFLGWFDEDPNRAFEEFYKYAYRLLSIRPPRDLRFFADEREDLIQEIIVHCCADDFRVLRRFDATKGAFPPWFHFVARNRIRDLLERRRRTNSHEVQPDEELPMPGTSPAVADRDVAAKEMLGHVREAIGQLKDRCRTLLLGAADELGAKELAPLVGLDRTENKRVADDLRYCRRRLIEILAKQGLDPGEIVSPRRSEPR